MKKLLFLLLFPMVCSAQYESFKVDESSALIWQKFFESDKSAEDIIKHFKSSGVFKDIQDESETSLTGAMEKVKPDFKGAGFGELGIPMYCSRNMVGGFASVEIKDGKYRVTIKKMVLEQIYETAISGQGQLTPLDDFAYKAKRKKWPGSFKKPAAVYEYTFSKLFKIVDSSEEDW